MSLRMRSLAVALIFTLLAGLEIRAQERAKSAAGSEPGLSVGTQAPRFTLKDQAGRARSLDEFLGKGKVALVFYRSADW